MCKQSTDGAKNDGALPNHQAFPNPVARFGGLRVLQLLVADGGTCPLLVWTVIFVIIFSFKCPLSNGFGGQR